MIAGSMPCNPVMVFRSTGNMLYSASASTEGKNPNAEKPCPNHCSDRPASASSSG
ncbi:Uncharacterised protein [Mycobacterium tuberculosis]|nr:Uncharacterised protein [Mycobacterium tuberculosis]